MADNVSIKDALGASNTVAADDVGGVKVQRIKIQHGADGSATDVSATSPLPTKDAGTYGYAAGTSAASVDVPTGARIKRVSLIASSGGSATVTILGGATITVPASGGFDETVPGDCLGTSANNEVVFAGSVASYYVGWTV